MLQLIPSFLNGGLETALNGLLARSQNPQQLLRKLKDKVLTVQLQQFDFKVYFIFSAQRIDLLNQYEGEADCAISLKPSLLLKMPNKANLSQYLNDQSIILQGDLQLLQDFVALLEGLEKDPAELLSPYVGDIMAFSLVSFLQKLASTLKRKFQQHQQFSAERLTEEWQVVAPSLAIVDFCDQVKTLEKNTALLEQKIQRLSTGR